MTVSEVTTEGMEDRGEDCSGGSLVVVLMVELVSCGGVGMGAGDSVTGEVRKRIGTGVKRNGLRRR